MGRGRGGIAGRRHVGGDAVVVEQRIAWENLPGQLKEAIAARTGPITGARAMTAGQNSPLAAVIDTAEGRVFVKGLPSGHRKVITQDREAAVAPLVTVISPAVLWHFDDAGWNVLGYQYIPGRHADYRAGSPDLDQVVRLMTILNGIEVPADPGPLKRAEDRCLDEKDGSVSTRLVRTSPSELTQKAHSLVGV
jgi:hypothetical protein